ncbi:MAG: FAD-dependent oxidoreductase [Firmicutes bacterium]|nr:FAD-dependent oxidoreductase [Bacillota bacterium]
MKSIFEDYFEGFNEYPSLSHDLDTDIAIVGGGVAGLLSAYFLSKEGFKVSVFEADKIASKSTARSTATLSCVQSPMYARLAKKNPRVHEYFESQKEALKLYREIIEKHNIDCDFETMPSYLFASNEKSEMKLREEYTAMREFTDEVDFVKSRFGHAIKMENQAQFNALKFLAGIGKDFGIFENTKIVNFILDENKLITEKGNTIRAKKIIIATRFPVILNNFYYFKMYQAKSYVVTFKNPPLGAMFNGAEDGGLYMRSYKDYMLLGGYDHRTGKHKKCADYYFNLKRKAKEMFGAKDEDFGDFWSAEDSVTYDDIPFAGSISKKHPNVFVITGFNEWGLLNGMICGRVVSNLIANQHEKFAELFSPHRKYCRKNIGSLLPHGLISAGSLLKAPFVKKRCSHIGCALKFNKIENVYECPCHGSRFNVDGKLLDGPAVKDLK